MGLSDASPPPPPPPSAPLSLTLTELLAELAEALAEVAPEAVNSPLLPLPLPLPLPEARPMNSVGAGVDGGSPLSQSAASPIAVKSSVVRPAAAEVEAVLDSALDEVEPSQVLSEVPARTTEPSMVAVAAVTHSLPGVPSCSNTRVCGRIASKA